MSRAVLAFPVRGPAAFAREFAPPRHNGVDIYADRGSPVLAPDDGEVRFGHDPLGGLVFNLTTPSGVRYYGAHLMAWQGQDRSVRAGDVIGYVGTSGNAAGAHPHLHLEKRDFHGAALDPYADLDAVAPPETSRRPPYAAEPQPTVTPAPAPAPAAQPVVTATIAPVTLTKGDLVLLGLAWWLSKGGRSLW